MKLSYLLYILLVITNTRVVALCFLCNVCFQYYMASKDDTKWLLFNSEYYFPSFNSNRTNSISHFRITSRTPVQSKSINVVITIRPGGLIPPIPHIKSSQYHIQTINYVMSNYTYTRNMNEVRGVSHQANITITNFLDDHDYLSFALSFYYRSDYVVAVVVDSSLSQQSVSHELNDWLVKGVNHLDNHPGHHFVSGVLESTHKESVANFLCISNVLLRQLIMYSDITFDHPSLFTLLPVIALHNSSWINSELPTLTQVPLDKEKTLPAFVYPHYQKCPSYHHDNEDSVKTYDVFLRLYKRQYLRDQLTRLYKQTVLPKRVFLLQNRDLVNFGFDGIVNDYKDHNIVYIWNVNWNSFFHLSYLLSSFSSSSFSFTYDDDQLLTDENTHKTIVTALINQPGIYSLRPWCWCKQYMKQQKVSGCASSCQNKSDLVVNPFFTYSVLAKNMWRYDIPMYYCCEEMSLLLPASIECNTPWYYMSIEYESKQADRNHRNNDPYTKKLKKRVNWKNIEHEAMDYYVRAGYKVPETYDEVYVNMNRTIFPI